MKLHKKWLISLMAIGLAMSLLVGCGKSDKAPLRRR